MQEKAYATHGGKKNTYPLEHVVAIPILLEKLVLVLTNNLGNSREDIFAVRQIIDATADNDHGVLGCCKLSSKGMLATNDRLKRGSVGTNVFIVVCQIDRRTN